MDFGVLCLTALGSFAALFVFAKLIGTSKWPRTRPYGENPFVAAKAAAKTANRKHKRGVPGGVRCKGEADRVSHTAARPRKRTFFHPWHSMALR